MNAITFDTLKYAQILEAEGVDKKQAEAHATALNNVLNNVEETGIATKNDLLELKISLIKWMITLLITTQTVFVGIIFTLLKFFST